MKKFKSVIALLLALIMIASCGAVAFATDLVETDDNNAMESATDFELTDTVKGRIETDDDVDYFTFDAEKAGIAVVTFTHDVMDASQSYFSVKVLDKDGLLETEFSVLGKDESTSSTKFGIEKGVHYIVVSGGQVVSTTLDYKFSVSVDTEARAEKEPNNSAATATAMEYSVYNVDAPKRYVGNLSQNDVDYFVVNFKSSGYIRLYLYNSNGKTGEYKAVVSKFIEGAGGESVLANVGSVEILSSESSVYSEPIGVSAGKYYIKINGTVGGYETRVLFYESISEYETEYNNDYSNSEQFSLGEKIIASLFDENDTDCFKFTVTKANKAKKLIVTPNAEAPVNAKWIVSVYNDKDEFVTSVEASVGSRGEIDLNEFDEGIYYIVIRTTKSYHDAARYEITAEKFESTKDNRSFIEKIRSIDWSKFLQSFAGWFTQIDFAGITKSIVASIKTIFGMLDL
ncbi:MAG: hypothetical protein MJ173_01270 [Clostridia bacterium]|nr:hypothetical protein [Clostridia bacterium]